MKILELFSGYGTASHALKRLGIDYELVGYSDIDKFANQCFKQNHCPNDSEDKLRLGDITKIDINSLPDFDLLTGGTPCVLPGTLITTQRGLIPIEEVLVGDKVLTHKNRWRNVLKTMNQMSNHYYEVKIQGSPSIQITEEHPFYCKKMVRVWNKDDRTNKRVLSNPEWINTKDLRQDDFVGFGTFSDKYTSNEKNLTDKECWLLGRYVADGYIGNNKRKGRKNSFNHKVIFCIGKSKQEEFLEKSKDSYNFCISNERTSYKNILINERFMNLCKECGCGAKNKKVPFFILNLPKSKLKLFFDGYMSGDGCYTNNYFSATSISKVLIYQLGQIVHRLYQTPYNISYCKRPKTTVIEGRTVNQNDTWSLHFNKEKHKQDNGIFEDRNMWGRFVSKDRVEGDIRVYNLEIEEDNSYVANNLILHNCQDFSVAGKGKGLFNEDGTPTRSGLLFEYVKILEAKKPKYFMWENVKGVITQKHKEAFIMFLEKLCSIGYEIDFKLLNTKDYGIPQNRERVFVVGRRIC
jgi:intein/homing endonuclease